MNRRALAGPAGALVCLALAGCASAGLRSGTPDSRTALRVEVDQAGRPTLFGQPATVTALVRRLRREGAARGRAVALHGGEGTTPGTLWTLRQTLVRQGIPNVSIVTARRASVETADDEAAPATPTAGHGPGDTPQRGRTRRR